MRMTTALVRYAGRLRGGPPRAPWRARSRLLPRRAILLLLGAPLACSGVATPYSGSSAHTAEAGAAGTGGAEEWGGASSGGNPGSPSAGCGQTMPEGRFYVSRDVGGVTRNFYVMPPTGVSAGEMVPLLIGYHWHDGSGQEMGDNADLRAMEGRVLAIYPDGLPQDWLGGVKAWDIHDTNSIDIAATRAVIDYASETFCIDTSRVFAYGISWGGWMVNLAGCALGSELRGIAPVAGGGPRYPEGTPTGCAGPVATIIFHGTNDADEPVARAYTSRDAWRELNTCSDQAVAGDPALCGEYQGCAPGAPLVFCEHQEGHGLPVDWGMAKIWSFFASL